MTRKAKNPTTPVAEKAPLKARSKLDTLVELLRDPPGATLETMMTATGWQAHSVRGAISGSLKKKMGLIITSEKIDGVRTYRASQGPAA